MSTKIYNAYRLKIKNLDEANTKLDLLSKEVSKISNDYFYKAVLKDACQKWCELVWYNPYNPKDINTYEKMGKALSFHPTEENKYNENLTTNSQEENIIISRILQKIWKDCMDEKSRGYRSNSDYDTGCDVTLMPYKKQYYCMFFCSNEKILTHIANQKWLEPYNYWDNTDKPDKITEKEWEERRKTWEGIFKKSSIPKEVGLTSVLSVSREEQHNDIHYFKKTSFTITNKLKESIKKEFLLDILLVQVQKDPEMQGFLSKKTQFPMSLIMQADRIVRGKETVNKNKEFQILSRVWQTVQKEMQDYQYSWPTKKNLFENLEKIKSQQEINYFNNKVDQNTIYKTLKL